MVAALIEMKLRTKFKVLFHVIVLNETPPWFGAEVLGNGVKLYEKEVKKTIIDERFLRVFHTNLSFKMAWDLGIIG